MQLLPFEEPSAPAIADAMLADAVGLTTADMVLVHDAEAWRDEDSAVQPPDLNIDPTGGTERLPATEEERVLFDALIIRSVDNSSIGATVNDLHHIQAIIAARRAL
ncbi:hypothetical protein D3C87_1810240 [compost metagenome]